MIQVAKESDKEKLLDIIRANKLENVYLYIDILAYGVSGEVNDTYCIYHESDIVFILYRYYNSLQVYQVGQFIAKEDLLVLHNHVVENQYQMISGNKTVMKELKQLLSSQYALTEGALFYNPNQPSIGRYKTENANVDDYQQIAELIVSDKNIGGHYTVALLKNQLLERRLTKNCRNLVIKQDGKIVSHVATYAETEDLAVIGGVITHENYRGKGYAAALIDGTVGELLNEGKLPVLYCYECGLMKMYKKMGWIHSHDCAKLEKIGE